MKQQWLEAIIIELYVCLKGGDSWNTYSLNNCVKPLEMTTDILSQ